jgi:pimeloyl-ACP methyl ester carboxylesterase
MMPGSEVSSSTVEVFVRGIRSPVLTAGPPGGAEAVVFIHGNPGPADDWRGLLTRAGEPGRAIVPRHARLRPMPAPFPPKVLPALPTRMPSSPLPGPAGA